MKIHFWSIGKTHEPYVRPGIEVFTKRISHYYPIEWKLISPPKNAANLSVNELKKAEAETLLNLINQDDVLILLDEKGKQLTSEELANLIQTNADKSYKSCIFLIGGAFGVDEKIIKRANIIWSLSKLVFPHQLVRLILTEQIYRACTINRNEKYHHT